MFQKNYYAKNILTVQSIHMRVGNADFFFLVASLVYLYIRAYTLVHLLEPCGLDFFVISLVRLNKFLFVWNGFFCRN